MYRANSWNVLRYGYDWRSLRPGFHIEYFCMTEVCLDTKQSEENFLDFLERGLVSIGELRLTGNSLHRCKDPEHIFDYMKACAMAASKNPNTGQIKISFFLFSNDTISNTDYAKTLAFTGSKPVHLCIHRGSAPDDKDWDPKDLAQITRGIKSCPKLAKVSFTGYCDRTFGETVCTALATRATPTIQNIFILQELWQPPYLEYLDQVTFSHELAARGCVPLEGINFSLAGDKMDALVQRPFAAAGTRAIRLGFGRMLTQEVQDNLLDRLIEVSRLTRLEFGGRTHSTDFFVRLLQSKPSVKTLELRIRPDGALNLQTLLTSASSLEVLKLRVHRERRNFFTSQDISTNLFRGLEANTSLKVLEFHYGSRDSEPLYIDYIHIDLAQFCPFVTPLSSSQPSNRSLAQLEELHFGTFHISLQGLLAILQMPESTLKKLSICIRFSDQHVQQFLAALRANKSLQFIHIRNPSRTPLRAQHLTMAKALAGMANLKGFVYQDMSDAAPFPETFRDQFLAILRPNQSIESASLQGFYSQSWLPGLQEDIDNICFDHYFQNQFQSIDAIFGSSSSALSTVLEAIWKKCPPNQRHKLYNAVSPEFLINAPPHEAIDLVQKLLDREQVTSFYTEKVDASLNLLQSIKDILNPLSECLDLDDTVDADDLAFVPVIETPPPSSFRDEVTRLLDEVKALKEALKSDPST